MRWARRTPYYAVSDCGAYTVSQAPAADGDGFMYTAWAGKTAILYTRDPKAAAKACADHQKTSRPSDSRR